jgi:transposase-like protein
MSAHAVPFYCPYCGEEDLVPTPAAEPAAGAAAGGAEDDGGSGHGRWSCRACTRTFQLRLARPARPAETASRPTGAAAAPQTP